MKKLVTKFLFFKFEFLLFLAALGFKDIFGTDPGFRFIEDTVEVHDPDFHRPGMTACNEKKEKDEMEDSHLEDIPNDGQGTDRKNQSIGLHDPILKSPDKPPGPTGNHSGTIH